MLAWDTTTLRIWNEKCQSIPLWNIGAPNFKEGLPENLTDQSGRLCRWTESQAWVGGDRNIEVEGVEKQELLLNDQSWRNCKSVPLAITASNILDEYIWGHSEEALCLESKVKGLQ